TTRQSELKLPDTVLFDRLARGNFTAMLAVLDQGKPVQAEINRRTVSVTSSFSLGATFNTDGTLIGNETAFLHLFPNRDSGSVTFGLVTIAPTADRQRVVADLKRKFPDDVNVLTREEFIQDARDFQLRYTPIGFIFGLGTVMGFLVGLVMVYQILSSDVADHMSEYATFKAMGYTDLYLLGIMIEESLILAGLGFIPGLISGFGIMRLIHAGTALPVSFPMTRIAGVFLLTLGMCIVSGFIAARRIRQADPAEIFS
ncbi:MAG TPA: FtsX-like permease family protein, partial [Acidobacteriota bacterium]|nr:FtsX-like permease family protein [Acidobacteriota bacterium]